MLSSTNRELAIRQYGIDPERNYTITEASALVHRTAKTLRTYTANNPKYFPHTINPLNGRKQFSGTTLLKLVLNKINR